MSTPDEFPDSHGDQMPNGPAEPVTGADIVDVIRLAIGRIKLAASLASKGLASAGAAKRTDFTLDTEYIHVNWTPSKTAGRPWCDVDDMDDYTEHRAWPVRDPITRELTLAWRARTGVMGGLRNVAKSPIPAAGGSKVGGEWFPVVPPQVRDQVTKIVMGAWKRTFGDLSRVGIQDLDFFPHFSGSQWFPVVPGTTSGTWRWPPVSGSRSYRGNHWGATPGGLDLTRQRTKITGTTQPGSPVGLFPQKPVSWDE